MKYPVHNRFTGAVQFTADIDCAGDAPTNVKIGLAVKWALRTGADLRGATLIGANLAGANLRGATLAGADLRGIKIKSIICLVTRIIESYEFIAFQTEDDKCVIVAGCRGPWTVEEYRAHIAEDYPNTPKAEETLAILAFIEERAKAVMISRMED